MKKVVILWLCLVGVSCVPAPALALEIFEERPDKVEILVGLTSYHIFARNYSYSCPTTISSLHGSELKDPVVLDKECKKPFNETHELLGINLIFGDTHVTGFYFKNSYRKHSLSFSLRFSLLQTVSAGVVFSTGYEDQPYSSKIAISPVVQKDLSKYWYIGTNVSTVFTGLKYPI